MRTQSIHVWYTYTVIINNNDGKVFRKKAAPMKNAERAAIGGPPELHPPLNP